MDSRTPLRPKRAAPFVVIALVAVAAADTLVVLDPGLRWVVVGALAVAVLAGALAADRLSGGGRAARRALGHVTEQAERLNRGESLSTVDPVASDAVASLERVAERMAQLQEARAHIVATERDLDRARRMYRSILPLASIAAHGSIRLAGQCRPAAETGGDWWTYRTLSGGRLLVVVGDATGHGVYSAMIGCAAHGAVEALSGVGEHQLSPASVLTAINAAIRIPGGDRVSMTCFAALIDPGRGAVEFANASHMFPLIAPTGADGGLGAVAAMGGQVLPAEGMDDSSVRDAGIRTGSQPMAPGDVIVLFTDGLVEREDKGGRQFGYRRLQAAIQAGRLGPGEPGIAALRDHVLGAVDRFARGVDPDDDVTLIVCALDRG
jgi:phosphoserine phosphatase RsbU/P